MSYWANAVPEMGESPGHWLRRDLVAWPGFRLPPDVDPAHLDWRLHWSADDQIHPGRAEPVPWQVAALEFDASGLPEPVAKRFPHLHGYLSLRVPAEVIAQLDEVLRCQVALSAHRPSGELVAAGQLQLPGVLDQHYAAAAETTLGPSWTQRTPTLRLWAPTARCVALLTWPADASLHHPGIAHPMTPSGDGVWAITGEPHWDGWRYQFLVEVYTPHLHRVVINKVTDPYSHALTINSTHSVLVDLAAPELAPEQWLTATPPKLEKLVDQISYELHLRDFSISDQSVPESLRGSFLAPTVDSVAMAHLRRLAEAGMNTVQLLPLFDNAAVEEHPDLQERPEPEELIPLPPDSQEQQRRVMALEQKAPFNWGYEPWHFLAPEGSFSSTLASGDGAGRISECRQMVGAFHAVGMRVVLDQVYNHTSSSGQDRSSVLDRIVPGYYHRRSATGEVETSTCCANVATEHLMAGKLMVDACVHWVRHYRVDGFRFDLMGHHSRDNMLAVRAALDGLTIEADGVDGQAVTMFGEGWEFGEVANNARFIQATQGQLGGTGIATFSDRLRDAVRGGSIGDTDPRAQGFATGLLTSDNHSGCNGDQRAQGGRLAWYTDLVQLGLAGNLRAFRFNTNSRHTRLRGDQIDYGGHPAGYADQPDEVISYVDAHDNETLFDALTLKLHPATPMAVRVRANTVALSLATLGQSPVMWHAGTDILRSKSLDRNSFRSGDWFNYLDFSMTDNGFGAGLPPAPDNARTWPLIAPLLADPRLKPTPEHIRFAHAQALDLLRLRASSRMLRLGDADQIIAKVSFPASDNWQGTPGVIVMRIDDRTNPVDPRWSGMVVVFNATNWLVRQSLPFDFSGFELHPVQAAGADEVVKTVSSGADWVNVPAWTTAVFTHAR